MNYLSLLKRYSLIRLKIFWEYKASFVLHTVSSFTYLLLSFLFWGVIYSYTDSINGWTFAQIMMLHGFFHLFVGIYWFFFHFSEKIDSLVIHGDLDKMLSKPVNPLVMYMFQNISFFSLMDILKACTYFWIAMQLGITISLLNFAASLVMIIVGACLFTLILTTVGTLSFWFGRTESISFIWRSLWEVGTVPLTIFPLNAQMLFTFIMPIIFMQTYPTLLTTQQISLAYFAQFIAIQLALMLFWFMASVFMWRKGLKRYSSYGG